jgi:putative endonuclease
MSYFVNILKGASGRHYFGMTSDLERRLKQHRAGQTHTTRRLGGSLQLVVAKEYSSHDEATAIEKMLKSWKSPTKAIEFLRGA